MASSSSSSSLRSSVYIPPFYPLISEQQQISIEEHYGLKKDEGKESDPDKRITKAVESSIMACSSMGSSTYSVPARPLRQIPRATALSAVEIWDLAPPPERVISSAAGSATAIRHNPAKLAGPIEFQACYDNVQFINRFFLEIFSINPVQTPSHTMQVKMYKRDLVSQGQIVMNNAAWHGGDNCVYVTHRDETSHNPLEANLGVISHEFGHAVIHYSSRFDYRNQSGALHEHGADVIGIMTKHYRSRQLAGGEDTDWRIGENIFISNPTHSYRSMSHPGRARQDDDQPDHMRAYRPIFEDAGGVHLYCGIPNKAFYLTASRLGGHSWERAGRIWVTALQDATQHETFEMFSHRTAAVTKQLYGEREYDCVRRSWHDVGVCTRDWEMIASEKRKISCIDREMRLADETGDDCIFFRPFANVEMYWRNVCRDIRIEKLEKIYYPIRIDKFRLAPI